MSCADRTARALIVLACIAGAAACGGGSATEAATSAPASTAIPADATTRGLAEVEFARLCTVGSVNFANEAALDADLDGRLSAAGFSHEQWKAWHDSLADSPDLVAQYTEVTAAGCPAG